MTAGVGGRLKVPRDEAIEAVQAHMIVLRASADLVPKEDRAKWTWKDVVQLNYCVEALALLRMLDRTAYVFACRFYKPTEGANKLSCGWALGYFHALAQPELVRLQTNVIPAGAEVNKYDAPPNANARRRVSNVVPIALKDDTGGILATARRRSLAILQARDDLGAEALDFGPG